MPDKLYAESLFLAVVLNMQSSLQILFVVVLIKRSVFFSATYRHSICWSTDSIAVKLKEGQTLLRSSNVVFEISSWEN